MKTTRSFISILIISFVSLCAQAQSTVKPASPPANFTNHIVMVNGVKIHYVIGGKGEPLLLLHGFGQNWYMWNRLLPELSKHFTVIAPDMRGIGESGKPAGGYDKKTMAVDMHELMKKLGFHHTNLAGHDVGLMVAYAYAAQFPGDVKKLALMDALLPGIEPVWTEVRAQAWWFGFFAQPHSGELVSGRIGLFFTDFWPVVGYVKNAFTTTERTEFIRAYSVPGSTTGAFHWFGEFSQDAKDNVQFMKTKLTMPVLAMAADHSAGPYFTAHCKLVATNVKESVIHNAGHWIVQENTPEVQKGLLDFFLDK